MPQYIDVLWASWLSFGSRLQYIPRNMHTVFALLCFVVVIHWLIFPYPSGLLHWHCGNLTIAPVPAKQPWWIWINTSCEFIMNDCITTTKQSTTKPCAYFLGYTVALFKWHPRTSSQWRHVRAFGVWNHQQLDCFSQVVQTNPCKIWMAPRYWREFIGGFPSQRVSNAEIISMSWHHHDSGADMTVIKNEMKTHMLNGSFF